VSQGLMIQACDLYGRCSANGAGQSTLYVGKGNEITRNELPNGDARGILGEGANGQVAFDQGRGKFYWTTTSAIRYANPDGSQATTLLSGLNNPRGLAIDPQGGKIYWGEANRVARANLDGSGIETLIGSGSQALAVDPARGKLYYGTNATF